LFSAIFAAGIKLDEDFLIFSEDRLLSELSLEYTRLFVGPGKHVSPYESVHASDSGSLRDEAASTVQRIVESAGIEFQADYHGMPDHIRVELEFMQ
jgi:TorA maturation chaperone TorD